jgi:hypothetical protein
MRKAAIDSGACLEQVLDSPSKCDADPVVLRARERARDAAERRRAVLAETRGMTAAGQPFLAQLEKIGAMEFAVGPGLCHVLVWQLAEDAKPANVRISLDFVTRRSVDGGLTGFDTNARIGSTGVICSSQSGKERFRIVDAYTYAQLPAGGTGGLSFVLFTRPRQAGDPDDVGASVPATGGGGSAAGEGRAGGGKGDYVDCVFPCESAKTDCDNECFRREAGGSPLAGACKQTCEQIYRSCVRPCE